MAYQSQNVNNGIPDDRVARSTKKSAVLVYGESPRLNKSNSVHRYYKLGKEVIKEATSYDHLGLKNNCL